MKSLIFSFAFVLTMGTTDFDPNTPLVHCEVWVTCPDRGASRSLHVFCSESSRLPGLGSLLRSGLCYWSSFPKCLTQCFSHFKMHTDPSLESLQWPGLCSSHLLPGDAQAVSPRLALCLSSNCN